MNHWNNLYRAATFMKTYQIIIMMKAKFLIALTKDSEVSSLLLEITTLLKLAVVIMFLSISKIQILYKSTNKEVLQPKLVKCRFLHNKLKKAPV